MSFACNLAAASLQNFIVKAHCAGEVYLNLHILKRNISTNNWWQHLALIYISIVNSYITFTICSFLIWMVSGVLIFLNFSSILLLKEMPKIKGSV